MKASFVKTVIINRAVPGSGKTTIARCITQALRSVGLQVINHSTDEFFMHDGRYCFDISKLHKYHQCFPLCQCQLQRCDWPKR